MASVARSADATLGRSLRLRQPGGCRVLGRRGRAAAGEARGDPQRHRPRQVSGAATGRSDGVRHCRRTPRGHVRRSSGAAEGRGLADRDGAGVAWQAARLRSALGGRRSVAGVVGSGRARRRESPTGCILPVGGPTCPKSSPPATSWCCRRPGKECRTWCWKRWPAACRWSPPTSRAFESCSARTPRRQTVRHGDTQALVDAITAFMRDPALSNAMGIGEPPACRGEFRDRPDGQSLRRPVEIVGAVRRADVRRRLSTTTSCVGSSAISTTDGSRGETVRACGRGDAWRWFRLPATADCEERCRRGRFFRHFLRKKRHCTAFASNRYPCGRVGNFRGPRETIALPSIFRPFATRENRGADLRPPSQRRTFTGARVKLVLTDGEPRRTPRCEMRETPASAPTSRSQTLNLTQAHGSA